MGPIANLGFLLAAAAASSKSEIFLVRELQTACNTHRRRRRLGRTSQIEDSPTNQRQSNKRQGDNLLISMQLQLHRFKL